MELLKGEKMVKEGLGFDFNSKEAAECLYWFIKCGSYSPCVNL